MSCRRTLARPPPVVNRNDCKAWEESGAKAAVGRTTTIADGGCPGTGLVMPHRRRAGEELLEWKQVRARVEHVFARMKTWKVLRDCRIKGDGVHHAMLGIARLHNLNLAGQASGRTGHQLRSHPDKSHLRDKTLFGLRFRLPHRCGLRFPHFGGPYVAVDH